MCSDIIAADESDGHDSDELRHLLHQYLVFDGKMLQVAIQWRDCYQLIEQYNDEQVTMGLLPRLSS